MSPTEEMKMDFVKRKSFDLFLARQSISIRILIHLFGKSLLISQNGESGLVGQGVQCGQSLV